MQEYISCVHGLGNVQDTGKWHIIVLVCILELSIGVSL